MGHAQRPEDKAQRERIVTVLEVSPLESDHDALLRISRPSKWRLHISRSCSEALALLRKKSISVVVCERDLPDGSWEDVLEHTRRKLNPPPLIVTSRLADDQLWSEVLDRGGYNLLSKPFNKDEVFRDINHAWLHWKTQQERGGRKKTRAAASERA